MKERYCLSWPALWLWLGLSLALTACSGFATRQGEMPDWVAGEARAYPQARYLLGRGSGPSRDLAQERARADLVKGLELALEARTTETQRFSTDGDAPGNRLQVQRRIETQTAAVLRGVAIAELWRDPRSGEYHALAVLDRSAAARRLRQEIAGLDAETRAQVAAARAAGEPLAALARAMEAVRLQEQRRARSRLLEVVAGVSPQPPWPLARLRADRDALPGRLRFAVQAPERSLAEALSAAVQAHGLQLVESGDAGVDYVWEGQLQVQPVQRREGWYWARGHLIVNLRRAADGVVLGRRAWPLKSAALEAATARRRLQEQAARVLLRDLLQVLPGLNDKDCEDCVQGRKEDFEE